MICRDGSIGTAGKTAPTNGYEPLLKIDFVVVTYIDLFIINFSIFLYSIKFKII